MSGTEEPLDAEVPAPVIVWSGQSGDWQESRATYRVVATLRVCGPPEEPPGWYVTVERQGFDALAAPHWLPVERKPKEGDYEVNEEYALVLETALSAIGERLAKVREKTKGTKK